MKILVSGGPVHAKLDAVKFVTNRFKGGLMAKLADELKVQGVSVTYLCSKGSTKPMNPELKSHVPSEFNKDIEVVYHDGFHDYRSKVMEMAPEFDAIVLGAAVANLIPVGYWKTEMKDMDSKEWIDTVAQVRNGECPEAYVPMPLQGKFPSHNFKPGDTIRMDWQIAPRIIDEVRQHMKKGATLFGFKLLGGAPHDELITAAYEVLLGSGAVNVFANDVTNLNVCYGVGKDRSEREILRDYLAEEIIKLATDKYYATEVCGELPEGWDNDARLWAYAARDRFVKSPEGFVYGSVAFRNKTGFTTTKRGKNETEGAVIVMSVDHEKRIIRTRGGKATLNAPLLDHIFKSNSEVDHILHYHDQVDGLPTYYWSPPGTVRDANRPAHTSFNIGGHGCYLLLDKDGNQL